MDTNNQLSRRSFVKIGVGGTAALGIAGLSACSGGTKDASKGTDAVEEKSTQTVTDLAGDVVEVPTRIDRIVDAWHAHNQITLMLGAGDKLVGTTDVIKKNPWFSTVYPRISEVTAVVTGSGTESTLNTEEMLNLKPDVVFASSKDMVVAARENGIPAVNCMFQDFEGLRDNVALTGTILGSEAAEKAAKWAELLDANIDRVAAKTGSIADADKPRVLHIANLKKLTVDGRTSIVNEWIELAGGKNVFGDGQNLDAMTMETIVSANPDVIILGGSGSDESLNSILSDDAWSGITAVKNKAVYNNPLGVFAWDRYSGEEALQILWVAQKLHPDLFPDIDMVKETTSFYQTFYGYSLTADEAQRIVDSKYPA